MEIKTMKSCLNVTMGSYDRAEVCELVGTFILSKLGKNISKKNTGLYLNDGLVVLRNINAWGTEKMRKIVIKMFQEDLKKKKKKVQQVFNNVKPIYENALHKRGYRISLKYSKEAYQRNSNKKIRNIICFNPPFSQTVKANV